MICFIIANDLPKRNRSRPTLDGCVPFIRSMTVRFLPLQLRQLRFHLCDQHLQLLLAFLARMRLHIPRVLLAVDPYRGVHGRFQRLQLGNRRDAVGCRCRSHQWPHCDDARPAGHRDPRGSSRDPHALRAENRKISTRTTYPRRFHRRGFAFYLENCPGAQRQTSGAAKNCMIPLFAGNTYKKGGGQH